MLKDSLYLVVAVLILVPSMSPAAETVSKRTYKVSTEQGDMVEVELKQIEGFVVRPGGEKIHGKISLMYKTRDKDGESKEEILSTDHLILFDDQNRKREIPIERIKKVRIVDTFINNVNIGYLVVDVTNWEGNTLRLGYFQGKGGGHINSWHSNFVLLDTGFDIMNFEMFTAYGSTGRRLNKSTYLSAIGFIEFQISQRVE